MRISGIRGAPHQTWPDFADYKTLYFAPLPPVYGVVFVTDLAVTVHSFDFYYDGPTEAA